VDCSISQSTGTEFEHRTADILQTFKVNGSQAKGVMKRISSRNV